jgi:hypothetical protein
MNTSTCIIAACAANARARKKEEPVHIHTEELYYKVTLRKYYYFKPVVVLPPTPVYEYPVLTDDVIPVMQISPTAISAKTYGIASSFSVKDTKCQRGIDAYIRENLESITSTTEWKAMHAKTLADYCKDVKAQYNVDIDPAYVSYTTEYYWEVK